MENSYVVPGTRLLMFVYVPPWRVAMTVNEVLVAAVTAVVGFWVM